MTKASRLPSRFFERPKAALSDDNEGALLDDLALNLGVSPSDWHSVALEIARAFVPAFQPQAKRGRPTDKSQHFQIFARFLAFEEERSGRTSVKSRSQIIREFAKREGISETQLRRIIEVGMKLFFKQGPSHLAQS